MKKIFLILTIIFSIFIFSCNDQKFVENNNVNDEKKELLSDYINFKINYISEDSFEYELLYDKNNVLEDSIKVYLNDQLIETNKINNLQNNTDYTLKLIAYVRENSESNTYYEMYYYNKVKTKEKISEYELIIYDVNEDSVKYKLNKISGDEYLLATFSLYQDDILIKTTNEMFIEGLNPETSYQIVSEIIVNDKKYSLSDNFKTLQANKYEINIDNITKTKVDFSIKKISGIDYDNINNISIIKNNNIIKTSKELTFDDLDANTEYTISIDLKVGEKDIILTKQFKTLEDDVYEIVIEEISYHDCYFNVNKVSGNDYETVLYQLYQNDNLITTSNLPYFSDLDGNTSYTIIALINGSQNTISKTFITSDDYPFTYQILENVYRLIEDEDENLLKKEDFQSHEIEILSINDDAEEVIIPDNIVVDGNVYPITKVKFEAFDNKNNLSYVKIGNNIDDLFYEINYNIGNLPYVKYVDTLDHVFYNCNNLSNIVVADNNLKYSSDDIAFYNKDKTAMIKYYETNKEEIFTLPTNVSYVSANCFANNKYLKEYINNNDNIFEYYGVFENCTNLERYTANNQENTNRIIYTKNFNNCEKLKDFDFTGIIDIRNEAFANCKSLVKIMIPGVNIIHKEAFKGCIQLTEAIILPRFRTLGFADKVFDGCLNLSKVYIGDEFFHFNKSITDIFMGTENVKIYTNATSPRPSWNLPDDYSYDNIYLNYKLEDFINTK